MTPIAAFGLAGFLSFLFVIACPLMMILMMRGMHGGRGHGHAQAQPKSREQMSMDELKRARDELNQEIGDRAEQLVAGRASRREALR
jgi:hypothetical protein